MRSLLAVSVVSAVVIPAVALLADNVIGVVVLGAVLVALAVAVTLGMEARAQGEDPAEQLELWHGNGGMKRTPQP